MKRFTLLPSILGVLALSCVVENEPQPLPVLSSRPPAFAPPTTSASAAPIQITTAPPPAASALTCSTDADCGAVARNGCCHDGRQEPINKAAIEAYTASFVCSTTHPVCPMHLVLDRRVPACDAATHLCKLVDAPEASAP